MKLLVVPLVVIAVALGFVAGRWSAAPEPAASTPSPAPSVSAAPPPAAPDPELSSLRATVARQEEELKALKKKAEEKPVAEKRGDAPEAGSVAEDLWKLVKNFKKGARGEDQIKAMKLIGDLKPEHASFFIAKYMEATEPEARHMALMCAAMAGGPDASNQMVALLSNADLDEQARGGILTALAGSYGMPNRLVLTDSLAQAGDRMMGSVKEAERAAAAGILGMKPRDGQIEQTLRNLAEADTSDQVRGAALMALARNGTPETLSWLKSLRDRRSADEQGFNKWQLDRAIAELDKD